MAKLVYGMNLSLDGYVDHLEFRPSPALFRHFIEQARDLTGSVYGRRMYEVMRSFPLSRATRLTDCARRRLPLP
jgi:hypothetical protein